MWPPFFMRRNHVSPPRFLNKLPVAPAEAGAYAVSQYQPTYSPNREIGTSLRWCDGRLISKMDGTPRPIFLGQKSQTQPS
jgi:hypothetical protein